jgi:hypothetical protein
VSQANTVSGEQAGRENDDRRGGERKEESARHSARAYGAE